MTGSLTESCLFHSTLSLKSQSFSFVLHNLMTKTIHPPGPWSGCIFNITTVFSVSKPTIKWSETKARSNGLCLSLYHPFPPFFFFCGAFLRAAAGAAGFCCRGGTALLATLPVPEPGRGEVGGLLAVLLASLENKT